MSIPTADQLLDVIRQDPMMWFTIYGSVYTESFWINKGPTGLEILEAAGKKDEADQIISEWARKARKDREVKP